VEELDKLKGITSSFYKFIIDYELTEISNPHAVRVNESKYLPPNSLVLSGN
jgi:hypothetical protein